MLLHACVYGHVCAVPTKARRGHQFSETGVVNFLVGARNLTQVLCRSSDHRAISPAFGGDYLNCINWGRKTGSLWLALIPGWDPGLCKWKKPAEQQQALTIFYFLSVGATWPDASVLADLTFPPWGTAPWTVSHSNFLLKSILSKQQEEKLTYTYLSGRKSVGAWRDDSAVKRICCSGRRLKLNS